MEDEGSSSADVPLSPTHGYLYACQRAELLGLPTPTEQEWLASEECARLREEQQQEEHDAAVAQQLDGIDDGVKRIGGGLEELNTILNATQKKINKFKNVCGSIGTLLKARVSTSSQPGTPQHKSRSGSASDPQPSTSTDEQSEEVANATEKVEGGEQQPRVATNRQGDINTKMTSHIDKLDSLISKAENAQYSMKNQTKQMKSCMK